MKYKFLTLVLINLCFNVQYNHAQETLFNKDFAPQEGLVKKIEKPIRDEICLNGSWQFMPVELEEGITFEEIKAPEMP